MVINSSRVADMQRFQRILISILFLLSVLAPQSLWAQQYALEIRIKDPTTGQKDTFGYKHSYALVVGVSNYLYWPSLDGVRQDVKEVRHALERHGFEVEVVKNPTRDELEKEYTSFVAKYGGDRDNRLLFYFAGHGETIASGYSSDKLGYLVARDAPLATKGDVGAFISKAINLGRFSEWAREIHAKHVLFVFDSCFSGARGFALDIEPHGESSQEITKRAGEQVRQFISAGTAEQTASDISYFRKRFVEALEGEADRPENNGNGDGYITGSELGRFLQEKVSKDTYRKQTPQFGKIQDQYLDRGDFVFSLESSRLWCREEAPPKDLSPILSTSSGFEFLRINAGEFAMGDDSNSAAHPLHRVTISSPFYISKYEVTQQQWTALMGKNPSQFTGDSNLPVENVSWAEVQEYIKRLNAKEGTTRYRLPTEAEWEYAARACTRTTYSFGDDEKQLAQYAWYDQNAEQRTHPVGKRIPNPWGMHDMHGNVWEWCQDWYKHYPDSAVTDPQGPADGDFRVYRGGGWYRGASSSYCRLASRHAARPHFRHPALGFRLVMTVPQQPRTED